MSDQREGIILSIHDMSRSFDRNRVLDHINLDLRRDSVMGLIGENGIGRSTMMKCLFGTCQKDKGEIILDGHGASFSGPKDALENRVTMVHQELSQYLERSIVDNLFLGHYPTSGTGVVGKARVKEEAAELLHSLGITVNLAQLMRNIPVSQQQMCEIAKAISYHSKIIASDEPTSSLTEPEVRGLFTMMRKLRDQGISLIYISHKMDEVFEICDQISVPRDGKLVMTKDTPEADLDELIAVMVSRSFENHFPSIDNTPDNDILSIQHLSTKFEPHIQDVIFNVREGEIFDLYGLVGTGRTGLLETIFGTRTRATERIYYDDELMNFSPTKRAVEHDFALITEEREANGLFLRGNLTFNTTITNLEHYKDGSVLSGQKVVKATSKQFTTIRMKYIGPEDLILNLSGGNQQEVIFGKWLKREPNVFMMDEPTHGIDVGAKYEIYELIIHMVKEGKAIIVVSSEMPEILEITNRVGVMSSGYLSGIVETKGTNQEELSRLNAKYL